MTVSLRLFYARIQCGVKGASMYHYIKDCVEEGKMKVNYGCIDDQLADILTKALDREKFLEMRRRSGVGIVI